VCCDITYLTFFWVWGGAFLDALCMMPSPNTTLPAPHIFPVVFQGAVAPQCSTREVSIDRVVERVVATKSTDRVEIPIELPPFLWVHFAYLRQGFHFAISFPFIFQTFPTPVSFFSPAKPGNLFARGVGVCRNKQQEAGVPEGGGADPKGASVLPCRGPC